jgi:predicted RNA polymerase sigma factor
VHTSARDMRDTDWSQILAPYDQLVCLDPSPVIALNPYYATRADLLRRLGRSQQSRATTCLGAIDDGRLRLIPIETNALVHEARARRAASR